MRTQTRVAFNAYLTRIAELNGVSSATEQFTVAPTISQTLEDRIRESTDFLGRINIVPVDEISGQTLGLSVGTPVAGRTNTATHDRSPREVGSLDERGYTAVKTDYDTYVKYQTLDTWAKFPDFQTRLRALVTDQIARDRIMIGWHGAGAAAATNLATNGRLQDVNKGWLAHMRADAPARVMSGVKVGSGTAADYRTLDALIYDARNELLDPWHRDAGDLVVITGSSLVKDKYLALLNSAAAPTETTAVQTLLLNQLLGARPAVVVPFFPENSVLVTSYNNLSVYYQESSRRRQIIDNPKRDRIEDYQSLNEAFVVEDYGKALLIEGIEMTDADAPPAPVVGDDD